MAESLVSDALCTLVASPRSPTGLRARRGPSTPRRPQGVKGIALVLRTGVPWVSLPGARLRLRRDLLAQAPRPAGGRGPCAAAPGAAGPLGPGERDRPIPLLARRRLVPAGKEGELSGPNPTDRGKPGSERHGIADAGGVLLALLPGAVNVYDSRLLKPPRGAVPPVGRGGDGRAAAPASSTPTRATTATGAVAPVAGEASVLGSRGAGSTAPSSSAGIVG